METKLALDPHLGTKLTTPSDTPLYRYRVGDYRIIYLLRESELLILILRAGHRKEIYRNVPP